MSETIILASKSASRRAMLEAAGVGFSSVPARIDERAIERALGDCSPSETALALSLAKAHAVALDNPQALVLGSDSLVVVDQRRFDKPASREEAAAHLRSFSGKPIELHSAAALIRGEGCVWAQSSLARLYVRDLSARFIDQYLDAEWPEVGHCAGVFRIEGLGVQLFERIEGDYFTILGMPLLGVLNALREEGSLLT